MAVPLRIFTKSTCFCFSSYCNINVSGSRYFFNNKKMLKAGPVNLSRPGGVCICPLNCNPCRPFCCSSRFQGSYHFREHKNDVLVFTENPGPGWLAFFHGLFGRCCFESDCCCCLDICRICPINAMGLVFTIENGKVKCEMYMKHLYSENEKCIFMNVVNINMVVRSESHFYQWGGSDTYSDNTKSYKLYYVTYIISHIPSSGTEVKRYSTKEIKAAVGNVDKSDAKKFEIAVIGLINKTRTAAGLDILPPPPPYVEPPFVNPTMIVMDRAGHFVTLGGPIRPKPAAIQQYPPMQQQQQQQQYLSAPAGQVQYQPIPVQQQFLPIPGAGQGQQQQVFIGQLGQYQQQPVHLQQQQQQQQYAISGSGVQMIPVVNNTTIAMY